MSICHGDFKIDINGKIITILLVGAFNEHAVIKYSEEIKHIVNSFNGQNFLYLVNALNYTGGTPEAFEESNKFNQWLNTKNLLGKAIVHNQSIHMDIATARISAFTEQNIREFDNEEDALVWLKSLS